MRHVAAAALAATGLVVALCPADRGEAGQQARATTSAVGEVDPDLHAALQRSRLFETQRALRAAVWYDGDHDVQIAEIQLSTPLFEAVPAQPRDPLVRAGGGIVAMPVQFGAARCDEAADGPAHLIIDVDGHELAVPLEESPADLLADLHADECAAAAILAEVDLHFGDSWERTGPKVIEGEIELSQRHDGVTAVVDQLLGNVIFHVVAGDPGTTDGPLMEVDDDQPSTSVPVTINASRCDPHALTEYKRTFKFIALVAVGDDEQVRVDVEAQGEAHRLLAELLPACLE